MTDPTPSVSDTLDLLAGAYPDVTAVIRAHIADLQRELDAARRDAAQVRELLPHLSEKLTLYYVATGGEYVGGVEHSQLQKQIAVLQQETPNG